MRRFLFYLLAALLLPQAVKAQFNSFQAGSYVLARSPKVSHQSKLKLQGAYLLLVKAESGQKTPFLPAEILSFRIGQKKYVAVGGFAAKLGPGGDNLVSRGFAEELDSGRVVLMRFEYVVDSPMMMTSGGMMSGGSSFPRVLYLLRRSSEEKVESLPASWLTGGGKKFEEALLPYLSSRPDLTQLVTDKSITTDNLAAVIRALNTNQPFMASRPITNE